VKSAWSSQSSQASKCVNGSTALRGRVDCRVLPHRSACTLAASCSLELLASRFGSRRSGKRSEPLSRLWWGQAHRRSKRHLAADPAHCFARDAARADRPHEAWRTAGGPACGRAPRWCAGPCRARRFGRVLPMPTCDQTPGFVVASMISSHGRSRRAALRLHVKHSRSWWLAIGR
jgi:hypothetical protein